MRNAYLEYKTDLDEFVAAYRGIRLSDAFINILNHKADKEVLTKLQLDRFLSHVIKVYPDRYVKNLFLVRLVTLLEEYLKSRLLEELNKSETAVTNFLTGYITDRKLTVKDVLDGPQKLAISFLDDILFHNLPKVEKIYSLTFKLDIKKLCDFKLLMTIVKMRHLIVHEGAKEGKSRQKLQTHSLQTCLDEINRLIENIEFSIKNGRPKKTIKRINVDGWGKPIFRENTQDIIDYETLKAWEDL